MVEQTEHVHKYHDSYVVHNIKGMLSPNFRAQFSIESS